MKSERTEGPRTVFSGTMWETGLVKSLLENADIHVVFNNEIMGGNQGGIIDPFPGGNVDVVVSEEDYEKAAQVVREYLSARGL